MANGTPTLSMSKSMPSRAALYSPWNERFLAEFKALVPWTGRSWDKGEKAWLVSKDFLAETQRLCIKHFGKVSLSKEVEALVKKDEEDFPHEEAPADDSDWKAPWEH